jgi:hypothetical protein
MVQNFNSYFLNGPKITFSHILSLALPSVEDVFDAPADPSAAFDDPSAAFDDPSAAFDDPSAAFDDPSAAFDDPSAAFDDPSAAFDDPSAAFDDPSAAFDDDDDPSLCAERSFAAFAPSPVRSDSKI